MADHGPAAAVLARDGLEWLLVVARERGTALEWTTRPGDDEFDPTLYSGTAGVVLALIEGYRHFGDERYGVAAARGAQAVEAAVDAGWELSSLYFGLAGMAFALRAAGELLGQPAVGRAATRALDLVRSRFDGQRWADQFELLGGNAGIALGAAAAGDLDLAVLAMTPYLATAEPTAGGVHWEVRAGLPARFHHISHGTLGIVFALAEIGRAAGRDDLIELALAGAADVISRNEAGPEGFLVPHSDPQHKPELVERYSYGWCHGPAGDAQAFRLLGRVTGDPAWAGLAGDIAARATTDGDGTRWSNDEHRLTPSGLAPRTGWAMGNAGIIRELLRYARGRGQQAPGYAITWPDHPPAISPGSGCR